MEDKLGMMYDSINAISNAKNMQDKYDQELSQQQKKLDVCLEEKADLEAQIRQLVKQRDQHREDAKHMADLR